MAVWIRLGKESDMESQRAFDIEGARIAVFKTPSGFRALDDSCSHQNASLSEGEVWDGMVHCPKHGSAFDLETGEARGLPATEAVRTWKLKVEEGILWVERP